MTTTLPPHVPGFTRSVPADPAPEVVDRLRRLLVDGDRWVLRPYWARYLERGDERDVVPVSSLTQDQATAVHAWLRQQRHHLHHALEGEATAPAGWVESQPLYTAVAEIAHLDF